MGFCGQCEEPKMTPLDTIRSVLWLNDDARVLIHKVKYQKGYEWLEIFRRIIQDVPFPFTSPEYTLIPVPLYRGKFLKRGFNQSEILIEYLKQIKPYPVSYDLKKIRETQSQSLLGRSERGANLQGVFQWDSRKPTPRKVVLIDDILTTGETLNACARVLKDQGTESVCGWTLFRAMSS
jgi:ComF family protein